MEVSLYPADNAFPGIAAIRQVEEKIFNFRSFKIFTHKNPDGDAIGSALALKKILELKNKSAEALVFDSLDLRFRFLPGISGIKIRNEFADEGDSLFIYLDCHSPDRTGFQSSLFEGKESIVIDHHMAGGRKELENSLRIVDSAASSTAEIILNLAEGLNWKMDRDVSLCLLAGILSDTGTFQHSNTSSKALSAVSRLVKSGINLKRLAENLFKRREFGGSLKIWGEILARISVDQNTKMAISFVSLEDLKKYGVGEDELAGLVNLLSGIPESDFSLLLVENKFGKIKASLRSESYKGVDVAKIAKAFGGGGHKLAAGFEIEGRIEEQFEMIKEKIAKEIKIY